MVVAVVVVVVVVVDIILAVVVCVMGADPVRTAVPFSGQILGTNHLEFVWFVPQTGPRS